MAAFLRNLVLILTAVTLLEHLFPQGSMGRVGRMVLGLVLIYTVMTSLGSLPLPGGGAADWLSQGQRYERQIYEDMVLNAWEDDHES
ncbi:MAG: hypothetical protein IJ461_02385 [Clostridia bacterium]|nr:hypothetical protein [Clostridia bacterium]